MTTQERAEKLARKAEEKKIEAEKEELGDMENDSENEDKEQKDKDKTELAIEFYGMRIAPR